MTARSVGGDIGVVPRSQNDGKSIADHNGRVHRSPFRPNIDSLRRAYWRDGGTLSHRYISSCQITDVLYEL